MQNLILIFSLFIFIFNNISAIDTAKTVSEIKEKEKNNLATAKKLREAYLASLMSNINFTLYKITKDRVIDKKEMNVFIKEVENFEAEYEKARKIYDTVDNINPKIRELVEIYTTPILRHGGRNKEKMSRIIAELSGNDVLEIEEDFKFILFIQYALSAIISFITSIKIKNKDKSLFLIPGILSGYLIIVLFLGILGF